MKQWTHYVSSGNEKQQGKLMVKAGAWWVRVPVYFPRDLTFPLKHLRVQIAGFAEFNYRKLSQHRSCYCSPQRHQEHKERKRDSKMSPGDPGSPFPTADLVWKKSQSFFQLGVLCVFVVRFVFSPFFFNWNRMTVEFTTKVPS